MRRHSFRVIGDAYALRQRHEARCSLCGLLEVFFAERGVGIQLTYITVDGLQFAPADRPRCSDVPGGEYP